MSLWVLIADSQPLMRYGLSVLIRDHFPHAQISEAATTASAISKVAEANWDLAIIDLELPGRGGLEVIEELAAAGLTSRALVFTRLPEYQYAIRCLKAGVAGYLTKQSTIKDLTAAIEKVISGGRFISSELAVLLATEVGRQTEKLPHQNLSSRELQVFNMLAKGKNPNEIAEELSLSVKTVSTYRARVLTKLDLRNNVDIAHYALRHELLD